MNFISKQDFQTSFQSLEISFLKENIPDKKEHP